MDVSNGGRISLPGSTKLEAPFFQHQANRASQQGQWENPLAFLEHRAVLDLDVEQVYFLISLGDFPRLINPQDGVLDFPSVRPWLVDADMDWQFLSTRFFSQAQHK